MLCTFVKPSRRGSYPWLKDDNHFTYKRKGPGRKKTVIYYTCSDREEFFCRAGAVYNTENEGFIESFTGEHNHPPNVERLRARLEENTVLDYAVNSCSTQEVKPQRLLAKVICLELYFFIEVLKLCLSNN